MLRWKMWKIQENEHTSAFDFFSKQNKNAWNSANYESILL